MWSTTDLMNRRVFMELGKSKDDWGEFSWLKVCKMEWAQMFKKGKIYKSHGGRRKRKRKTFFFFFLEWGKTLFDFLWS